MDVFEHVIATRANATANGVESHHAWINDGRRRNPITNMFVSERPLAAYFVQRGAVYRWIPGCIAEGLRIILTRDTGELGSYLQILKEGHDALWRDAVYQSKEQNVVDSMFKELNAACRRKRMSFRLETSVALMGAIYMLEQVGLLKTDEYNGIKLGYAGLN